MKLRAYTEDLKDFRYREIRMLRDILNAWIEHGLPDGFEYDDVRPAMNMHSGYVFLTNADCQVAMLNGNKLELWHCCPECGFEGFKKDLLSEGDECCKEYLREIGEIEEEE